MGTFTQSRSSPSSVTLAGLSGSAFPHRGVRLGRAVLHLSGTTTTPGNDQ